MKIERINENQIRCTLTSFDLSTRNLNLRELAYGSEKARNLFREMIQKAANEVGFEAEDIPLMVEAIPLSNDSVMLLITKIEDPEELDTRFSKFSPMTEDSSDFLSELASELLEGSDSLSKLLGGVLSKVSEAGGSVIPLGTGQKPEDPNQTKESSEPSGSMRIYAFSSLDEVSAAAKGCQGIYDDVNTLYKKPDSSQYFLVVKNEKGDALAFSRACNVLAEYAPKVHHEYASEAYYQEHYEVICKDKALQIMADL